MSRQLCVQKATLTLQLDLYEVRTRGTCESLITQPAKGRVIRRLAESTEGFEMIELIVHGS